MNGLEKIIKKIEDDNKIVCQNILDNAKKEAEAIISQAEADSKRLAAEISDDGKKEAELLISMAQSGAELSYKKKILFAKQDIINGVIAKTKESLKNAGDAEYADMLISLAVFYAEDGTGEMRLSKKDAERLGKSFEEKINKKLPDAKKIVISDEPADIDGGFLLAYNDTVQNCTFDALVDDLSDEIKDQLATVLFA